MGSYEWKSGSRKRGDAQSVGERISFLEELHGDVTPEIVVADANDESSPLHDHFEWNDSEAAHQYRLVQAGHLIRCVVRELPQHPGPPMRAFVVVRAHDDNVYVSTEKALERPDWRSQVLSRALSELKAFQAKYSELEELRDVFAAMSRALQEV